MPSERRGFPGGGIPEAVVADSSFLVEAVIDPQTGDGRHQRCQEFARELLDAGSLVVYSSLVYVEAPQYWRRLYAHGVLDVSAVALDERTSRQLAYREGTESLRAFIGGFRGYEVDFSHRLIEIATALAGFYNLRSLDAFTVALSDLTGVRDLVVLDRDFRRVEGLVLWESRRA